MPISTSDTPPLRHYRRQLTVQRTPVSRVINLNSGINYPTEPLRQRLVSRPETKKREKIHAHARSNLIFRVPLALPIFSLENHGSIAFLFRLEEVGNRKTSCEKKLTWSSSYLLEEFDYASLVGGEKVRC